jgi:hypothetical protein
MRDLLAVCRILSNKYSTLARLNIVSPGCYSGGPIAESSINCHYLLRIVHVDVNVVNTSIYLLLLLLLLCIQHEYMQIDNTVQRRLVDLKCFLLCLAALTL